MVKMGLFFPGRAEQTLLFYVHCGLLWGVLLLQTALTKTFFCHCGARLARNATEQDQSIHVPFVVLNSIAIVGGPRRGPAAGVSTSRYVQICAAVGTI